MPENLQGKSATLFDSMFAFPWAQFSDHFCGKLLKQCFWQEIAKNYINIVSTLNKNQPFPWTKSNLNQGKHN